MGAVSLLTTTLMVNRADPVVHDLMARSPIPVPIQYAIGYMGLIVMITSGAAMLKARNWGRHLYVIWTAINLPIGLATSPVRVMLIPGVVLYAVVVFILFRPKANQYFAKTEALSATESH